MSHARPHLETHSRAKGHSAVAGAAYRLGLRLYDRRAGQWHDFRKRQLGEEIVRALTIAPEGAPAWATAPDELWNRAEAAERRKDAQVARDYRIPVPFGLTDAQAGDLAEAMARFIATELGTAVSMGLHRDADVDALGQVKPAHKQGYHAHLYFPTRRIGCTGSDGDGSGMGEKLAVLSNKRTSAEFVERFNARWAELSNQFTEAAGLVADFDHRSYARLGIEQTPQPSMGAPAVAMERKGFFTRKGDALREIIVMSEVYKQAHAAALEAQHAQAVVDVANAATHNENKGESAPTPSRLEPVPPTPVMSLNSGSLVARFRASVGSGETEQEQVKHREAVSLVRVIQNALRTLERLAVALLRFAKDRERERAAMLGVEYELAGHREQRANAHQRLKEWEAAHPWKMAAAKTFKGDTAQMPVAWRRLKAEARAHHDEVQALKGTMRGHQVALDELSEQEAPLSMQRETQEGTLRNVVRQLAELGAGYAAQLVAVCADKEREHVERALSHHSGPQEQSDFRPSELALKADGLEIGAPMSSARRFGP